VKQALLSFNFNRAFSINSIKLNAPITVAGMTQRSTVSVNLHTDVFGSNTALGAQLYISNARISVVLT
jgi:hypothetical protein